MKLRMLLVTPIVAGVLVGCGGGSAEPEPTEGPTTDPTPTVEPGVARGEVSGSQSLRSSDGRLEVSGTSTVAFEVTIREIVAGMPGPPRGWSFSGPVYEITAEDGDEAATNLVEALELRFDTEMPLGVVASLNGDSWELVPSEIEGGVVTSAATHLSAFAVMRPSITSMVPPESEAGRASPEGAAAALEDAIKEWRSQAARATGVSASSSAAMELPVPLESALGTAAVLGALYSGVYDGVNQAFVSAGEGGGSFVLLIEPKLKFPRSGSEAQHMLADYFPGAVGTLFTSVTQAPSMYTYQAINSNGFMVLGFIEHEGAALAFVSVGSAEYVGAATDAAE